MSFSLPLCFLLSFLSGSSFPLICIHVSFSRLCFLLLPFVVYFPFFFSSGSAPLSFPAPPLFVLPASSLAADLPQQLPSGLCLPNRWCCRMASSSLCLLGGGQWSGFLAVAPRLIHMMESALDQINFVDLTVWQYI